MTSVVKKLHFKRSAGKLYFINKKGNLTELDPKTKQQKEVVKTRIKKQKGYLYYLDKSGHISKAVMKNYKF